MSKKNKQTGPSKNRKFYVSQIDTTALLDSNQNWNFAPTQSATCSHNLIQAAISPLSKKQTNVRSVRHFPQHPRIELSSSPVKLHSTRAFSTHNSTETFKDNILKTSFSNTGHGIKSGVVQSPNKKARERRLTRATNGSIETDSLAYEPKIEILDIALSPQIKRKMHGPKHEKILKLLQSYVPSSTSHKKVAGQTQSMAIMTTSAIDTTNELVMNSSHLRKLSQTQEVAWENLSKPVTPEMVLDQYREHLSPFEQEEINEHSDIYFISDYQHKIIAQTAEEYADERGDYVVMQGDHIKYQYEVIEMLGRGSFGQVIKVFDHKNQEYLALKIIRNQKKFQAQAKIEIKLLEYMTENQGGDYNITDLKEHFIFRKHVCLVFELMSLNLYEFLKKNKFQGLHLSVIRKMAIQILYALKFLNRHKIIHCDLKPENILLKQPTRTGVRLIDFGSSCFENEKLYTYIQSRFYRSPEIILGLSYSTQIDMWSFGCLLCELYTGYPIFAGETEQDQLLAMMEVLGVPDVQFIAKSPRKKTFFDDNLKPKLVPNSKGRVRIPNSISLLCILECEDTKFVDLIQVLNCLIYDPKKRFTPDDALSHPWILEELPKELKSQHMKLIEKIDEKRVPTESVSQKQITEGRTLKEKVTNTSNKEVNLSRGASQPKIIEESRIGTLHPESLYYEAASYPLNQEHKENINIQKRGSYENKAISKNLKKDHKVNSSQGSLVISASINLNRSAQNTMRIKTNTSRENLFSTISPQPTKKDMETSARNEVLTVKNSEQTKRQEKLKKVTSTCKINEKQYGAGVASVSFKEDVFMKDQSSKENNPRGQENIVVKPALLDNKPISIYKSWNFSKGSETNSKNGTDSKKGSVTTSQKNVICLNLKSPKISKMV